MTNPAEQSPNPEIMTVAEADAYIHAVNRVFSEGTVIVPGVKAHTSRKPGSDGQLKDFVKGMLDVRKYDNLDEHYSFSPDEDIVWFETEATHQLTRHEARIAQFVMDELPDGTPRVRSRQVVRTILYGIDEPEYTVQRRQPNSRHISKARTPEERHTAEALFATMTTSFKALLSEKLVDKPDLSDRIEATVRDSPSDPGSQLGYGGILGRIALRKR
jgi:hypothetical protein